MLNKSMLKSKIVATIRYWDSSEKSHEEEMVFESREMLDISDALSLELAHDDSENYREIASIQEFVDGQQVPNSKVAMRIKRAAIARAQALMECHDDIHYSASNRGGDRWE